MNPAAMKIWRVQSVLRYEIAGQDLCEIPNRCPRPMKNLPHRIRRGFTLLELTVTIMVGMTVGATLLAMFNQQVAFLRIFRAQSFLNEEAPLISNHVSKLLLNAERFRLHASSRTRWRARIHGSQIPRCAC